MTPIYKKGQKKDPGNYRPVSPTSVPGKIMEWFILSTLTGHMQDKQGVRPSQYRFMKSSSSFLINLISFCYQATCLVDDGKLWILSTWILPKSLTLSPTAFCQRSSWLTAYRSVLFTQFKNGWNFKILHLLGKQTSIKKYNRTTAIINTYHFLQH